MPNIDSLNSLIAKHEVREARMIARATASVPSKHETTAENVEDQLSRALNTFRMVAENNWEKMRHVSRQAFLSGWKTNSYKAAFFFDGREVMSRPQSNIYNLIASLYIVLPTLLAIAMCVFAKTIYYAPVAILPFIGSSRRLAVYPQKLQIELALLLPLAVWLAITQTMFPLPSPLLASVLSYVWGSYICLALEKYEFAIKMRFSTRDDETYEALGKHGLIFIKERELPNGAA